MEPRPLSDMQQSMLVHEALANHPLYNMPLGFKITGQLDTDALQRALHHVIRRHPVLHSTFDAGVAVQLEIGAPLPELSLVAASAEDDEHALVITEFWQAPFDLRKQIPVRAMLMSVTPSDHYFVLCVHHVAGDSWALALLIRELGQAYATLVQGATPTNDSPPPDFFAYVAREQAAGWSTAWWREALRNLQPQPYPRDEAPQQTDRGLFVPVELNLNAADTQGVKRLARVARVSPAAVLFTAVSSAVAVGSGPYESAVGLPAALRDTRDLQETMGPLLNTLPVRTFWSSDLSATETVQRHAAAMESALAHKDVPYSRILKAAQIRRIPGAAPLLHLVNVDTEIPRLRLRGAKTAALHIPANWATFPALWEFSWQQIGNMSGVLRTDASFFTAEQANGLAQEFRSSLARLLK